MWTTSDPTVPPIPLFSVRSPKCAYAEALLATLTPEGKRPRAQIKLYDLTRKHVLAIQAEAVATPETANIRVKVQGTCTPSPSTPSGRA